MNRPPKKKPGPQGSSSSHEAAPQNAGVSQDDRNLVNIDHAFQEADVEDKVWLFWERNKTFLVTSGVIAIIAVLGIEGYKFMEQKKANALQNAYSQASSSDSLQSFGESNSAKPLGGFALLQTADRAYEAGEYQKAADLYNQVGTGLNGTPFAGRATLGAGIASLKAGDTTQGAAKLDLLADDATALDALRAEAIFNLVLLAIESEDYARASTLVSKMDSLNTQTIWSQQAKAIANETPQLQALLDATTSGVSNIKVEDASEGVEKPAEEGA